MLYALIGVVVLLVAVAVFAVRRGAAAARRRIDHALVSLDVQRKEKANFHGLASAGDRQVRGLGVLVLTPEELVFLQLVPANEVRLPRAAITDVELSRSFLGKTFPRDVLVVTWGTGDEHDRAAFDVPAVEGWRAALRPPGAD